MKKKFPVLETERLVLREIKTDDAVNLLEYLSDEEVMKYYGLEPFSSLEEALGEISWYERIFQEGTGIRWGITLKGEDKVIGSCGYLNFVSQHSRSDIGYEISKDYWGKGIAGEALHAVLAYGFETMGLERVQALIEPPNIASIKLVEKHGFTLEGLLRNYEYSNGKFDNLNMYSILKSEFLHS